MNERLEQLKKVKELIDSLELVKYDDLNSLESKIEKEQVQDLFGFKFWQDVYGGFVDLNYHENIVYFGDEYNRSISWSDNDSQPDNEWLYKITFPSGAYCLHDSYPTPLFKKMFEQLKDVGAKYSDTNNKSLYFAPSNAKEAKDLFEKIFPEYKEMVRKLNVENEIKQKELEIAKLKGELEC